MKHAFTMWAVALPGWGRGSSLKSCSLEDASALLGDLVLAARREGGWASIYVAGNPKP